MEDLSETRRLKGSIESASDDCSHREASEQEDARSMQQKSSGRGVDGLEGEWRGV